MGCDYYVITTCIITLKSGKEINIIYSRTPHYWWGVISEDHDDFTYEKRNEMEHAEMQKHYSRKDIYENQEWLVANKQKYYDIINSYKHPSWIDDEPISINDVHHIVMETHCQER